MGRVQLRRCLAVALLLSGLAWPAAAQPAHGVRVNGVNVWSNVIFTGGGTVAVSTPILDATQTWNAAGVTFTGWRLNVTDTASAAASLLLDLQVGGISKLNVTKAGAVTLGSFVSTSTAGYGFSGNGGASLGLSASGATLNVNTGGSGSVVFQTNGGNAPIMKYTATAPTVASGFGTSPAVLSGTTASFRVNVGTGGTATTGVITMPTATTGWNCDGYNLTALAAHTADRRTVVTATTTTSASLENQIVSTGATVGAPWAASDTLVVFCTPY